MTNIEKKINDFLLHLDKILFTKRKYFLGLCRDLGHYIRIYPVLLRLGIISFLIYNIWDDKIWESIVAKIIVTVIFYCMLRWIIPRRNY